MLKKEEHLGGLCILARREALTKKDWFDLLEARRMFIAQYLREMTLKSLGDLGIVHDDYHRHAGFMRVLSKGGTTQEITRTDPPTPCWKEGLPKNVEGDFPLDTRGIFPDDEVFFHGHFKWDIIRPPGEEKGSIGEILRFWGLTRNNEFIRVEVTMLFWSLPGELKKKTNVEKVAIHEATPAEICEFCGITPRWIWQRLGDSMQEWVKHRRRLLLQAEKAFKVIEQEGQMEAMIDIAK